VEFPFYPNEVAQNEQDVADLTLIEEELTEWAAYLGNHHPQTDEAIQALNRIRDRIASLKLTNNALQQHTG
jgi:hypothetical protein